jgi:hypothetical protein
MRHYDYRERTYREYKFYAPAPMADAIKAEAKALGITEIAFIKTAVTNQLKAQERMDDARGEAFFNDND